MKLISWNVAGLRACLKKGFADFFKEADADVVCLQEIKALEDQIDFHPEGYHFYLNPAEKKGYSGVGIYTRQEPLSVSYGMGKEEHDHEGRIMKMEFEGFYLVCVYVPNVKRDLSRLDYRMKWEDDFRNWVNELSGIKPVIVCGDMNVAHNEIDIRNAKANIGNAGFTYEERGKMDELLASGFVDSFRYLYPDKKDAYSWWSYMGSARAKNIGWRIDYFLVSRGYEDHIEEAFICPEVQGSDHCPVGLIIN